MAERDLVRVESVSVAFGRVRAVEEVSLSIAKGRTLGLVGESGSGKSTLGRAILGLQRVSAGRVFLGEAEVTAVSPEALRKLRHRMQLVFQDPSASLNPRMTVGALLSEPFEIHEPALSASERSERVAALLSRVGLQPSHAARTPAHFSGGQRQRIAIARALAVGPEFLFADEPVSALDVSVQAQILNLLKGLRDERGLTLLFVSHDLKVIEQISDEVAVMYLGRIIEQASRTRLFSQPRHPYTKALLSAIPDPRPGHQRQRILLEGEPPSPAAPPPGCAFHPRCPLRKTLSAEKQARCAVEQPQLRPQDELKDHTAACHFSDALEVPQ